MLKLKIVFILIAGVTLYSCGGEKAATEKLDKKEAALISKAETAGIDSLTREYRLAQQSIEKTSAELEALLTEIEK